MKRLLAVIVLCCMMFAGCGIVKNYKPVNKDAFIAACEKYEIKYSEGVLRNEDFRNGIEGVTYSLFANKGEASKVNNEEPNSTVVRWADFYTAYYLEFVSEESAKLFYKNCVATMLPLEENGYKAKFQDINVEVYDHETSGSYSAIARSGNKVFYIKCLSQLEYKDEAKQFAAMVLE